MANVNTSIANIQTDPLRNFKFTVSIYHRTFSGLNIGFMSVGGLNVTTEVIPYREGGNNTTTRKLPGQSDFSPITMSRGLIVGESSGINWVRELFAVQQGTGTGVAGNDFRAIMDIRVQAHPVTKFDVANGHGLPTSAIWRVYNAWPTSIAFSDLDAGANAIVVQQMTFAHEGFEVKTANSPTAGVKF